MLIVAESSPIRYQPSSSPAPNREQTLHSQIPSDSSGLFVRSRSQIPGSSINNPRRGDISNANTPHARRRIFMDESGRVVRDNALEPSDAHTFSNIDPNTSDAQAMGGNSTLCIWGTNVSINDTMSTFKDFLRNFTKKYRMWADGMSEEETQAETDSETKEYMQILTNMLTLGVTSLNLDFKNLKAYPPTRKIWQQAQDYPGAVIEIFDQCLKDVIFEIAEAQTASQRQVQSQSSAGQPSRRSRVLSSEPPVPSSDREEPQTPREHESDLVDYTQEVYKNHYTVRAFGLDQTINMRDLNPSGKSNTS